MKAAQPAGACCLRGADWASLGVPVGVGRYCNAQWHRQARLRLTGLGREREREGGASWAARVPTLTNCIKAPEDSEGSASVRLTHEEDWHAVAERRRADVCVITRLASCWRGGGITYVNGRKQTDTPKHGAISDRCVCVVSRERGRGSFSAVAEVSYLNYIVYMPVTDHWKHWNAKLHLIYQENSHAMVTYLPRYAYSLLL